MAIPEKDWLWFGEAGHFICASWCRFHLCTLIGDFVISTVGKYVHPRHYAGSEQAESEWLLKNPDGEEIGYKRTYETMVFKLKGRCEEPDCGCGGHPLIDPRELDFLPANTSGEARENHMTLCRKTAERDCDAPVIAA